MCAYNNRISGNRTVGAIALKLIKVADRRLGETEEVRNWEGDVEVWSSRVRTLVDAVYDWSRFNTLPRAYRWIRVDLAEGKVKPEELVRVTLRYGDVGTIRRMGALLEREGVEERLLRKLQRRLRSTSSPIPMAPRLPKRGKIDPRWGVVWNEADLGRPENSPVRCPRT